VPRITPCWEINETDRVLRTHAEGIEDHLFRAIHCQPSSLQYKTQIEGVLNPASPEEILGKLMDQNTSQDVLCVVKGNSGMGKSHLIQWLKLHIDSEDPNNVLLNIPKNGMSLKNILKRIINVLPENEQTEFLEKLEKGGGENATHRDRMILLLLFLQYEIETGLKKNSGKNKKDDEIPDKYKDKAEPLMDLITDKYLRNQYFLTDEHTLSSIAKHIFEDVREEETLGALRSFKEDDIPKIGTNERNKLSLGGQSCMDALDGNPTYKKELVELLNIVLQSAIRRTLSFTGTDLEDLMIKVREHLERQGKCLTLLIEDFASMDGIRGPILQVMVTENDIDSGKLCQIRWAMAITPEPFDTLPDTVTTRLNLIVDLDESMQPSIAKMASGYLNAIRWGDGELRQKNLNNVPSKCDDCPHGEAVRETCHNSFGHVDGIGLFPYTKKALKIMDGKTNIFDKKENFNPRKFINSVLKVVLDERHKTIEAGDFPDIGLLSKFGGDIKLDPRSESTLDELKDRYKDRRKALLELYDGTGELGNFSLGLHEAFGIPRLDGIREFVSEDSHVEDQNTKTGTKTVKEQDIETKTVKEPKTETKIVTETQPQEDSRLEGIQNWLQNKKQMDPNTVSKMGSLVFKAIVGYIDWDLEGFVTTEYAYETGLAPFKGVSITFEDQRDSLKRPPVIIEIKRNSLEATALQALVKQQTYGNWKFKDSADYLTALLESLKIWSENVIKQLNDLYKGTSDWNPIEAATELISLHLLKSGRISIDDNLEEIRKKLLKSEDFWLIRDEDDGQDNDEVLNNTALDKNFIDIKSNLITLTKYVSSINLMTKGGVRDTGQKGVKPQPLKNPLKLANYIDNFFPKLNFSQNKLPNLENIRDQNLIKIIKLYSKIKENFKENLINEKEAYKKWDEKLIKDLGAKKDINIFIDNYKNLLEVCKTNEIGKNQNNLDLLETLLIKIKSEELKSSIGNLDPLPEANPMESLILINSIKRNEQHIRNLIQLAENQYEENNRIYVMKMDDYTGIGDAEDLKKRMNNVEIWLNKIPEILAKVNILNEIE